MFWHGQYFVAVNGLTLLMFWHSRCFGTFDIIEPLMFWCSRTNAGERQSLRDLKYQIHLYTDCTKILTAPTHRPHCNTDSLGVNIFKLEQTFMPLTIEKLKCKFIC